MTSFLYWALSQSGSSGGSSNVVVVSPPGNQLTVQSSAVSLQITATDSDPTQTLTFTASGLPTGLSISSSGLITGTPTAPADYTVTVTATDTTSISGDTTFFWSILSAPTGSGTDTYVDVYQNVYGGSSPVDPGPPPTPGPPVGDPFLGGPVGAPKVSYTFLATDLVTNKILGELPCSQTQLDVQINAAGNMSTSITMDGKLIGNDDLIGRTVPGRTAFWAYREDQIVWGGIVWTRAYQSTGRLLSLTGQTFESYAARRFPRDWLGTRKYVFHEGQCHIINGIWTRMQAVTNGDIGVLPASNFPPGDLQRQLTVNGWDLSQSWDDIIQSLIAFSNGPDYVITWSEDGNGMPLKNLNVGAPIGKNINSTGLVTDFPGNVLSYTYTENASNGANRWYATGSGTDAKTLTGKATSQDSLDSGWPLIEGQNSFSDVTKQATIDSHANSALLARPMPEIIHAADIAAEVWPQFGTYDLGDYLLTNILDSRFPDPGVTLKVRVIGWSIQPPDTQNGVETISLVYDEPDATGVV